VFKLISIIPIAITGIILGALSCSNYESVTVTEEAFSSLISSHELQSILDETTPVNGNITDYKEVLRNDADELSSVDSWFMNQLSTDDGYTLIQIIVTDYTDDGESKDQYDGIVDSADEAIAQFANMNMGSAISLQSLQNIKVANPIGDAQVRQDFRAVKQGIGIVFRKGDKLVRITDRSMLPNSTFQQLEEIGTLLENRL
ncbi:uncharacterized protein METZ01_LOCUS160991, partial [marine metagenome]|jgi:hypothetical protein